MSKGLETKKAVLSRALSLASQLGLEGLSIGSLAKEVGMSKSGLFAHFASKEQLQFEVLRTAVDSFLRGVIQPALKQPRGEPRIRALFENWLVWARGHELPGGCVFMELSHELDGRPGPLRDRLVAHQRDWIEFVTNSARIAVEQGHFRKDLDTRQFAYDFYSILLAHHHFHRLLDAPDTTQRTRRAFEQLLAHAAADGGEGI